jgi:biotin--protein ligase
LKWPNDIYAKVDGELKKMGGILVTSEWFGDTGSFRVTIGCGLNVLNTRPSTCLQDLVKEPLEIEAVLAVILAEFEALYQELTSQENVIDVFGVFRERYYRHWLHTYY